MSSSSLPFVPFRAVLFQQVSPLATRPVLNLNKGYTIQQTYKTSVPIQTADSSATFSHLVCKCSGHSQTCEAVVHDLPNALRHRSFSIAAFKEVWTQNSEAHFFAST